MRAGPSTTGLSGASATARSSDGETLVLEVANDRDPIPPDSIARVFAPFWRRSMSKHRDGLGLGLFICAQVVKAHDGTLEVRSTAQAGTKFVARLSMGTRTIIRPPVSDRVDSPAHPPPHGEVRQPGA